MWILLLSLVAQVFVIGCVPSPWWVPDFAVIGLVLAVVSAPAQWFVLSLVAGLWMMSWAIRFPETILLSYLMLGWVVRLLVRRVDVADGRVQWIIAGTASVLMTFGALWLDGLWSLSLLGLASGHVVITILALPLVRGLVDRRPRPL